MKVLISSYDKFYGFVGEETNEIVQGVKVCIGDVVRVAEGPNNNECVSVVGIFTDKISVMGLGSTPISKLELLEIVQSHKELHVGSKLYHGHFEVRELLN